MYCPRHQFVTLVRHRTELITKFDDVGNGASRAYSRVRSDKHRGAQYQVRSCVEGAPAWPCEYRRALRTVLVVRCAGVPVSWPLFRILEIT